MSVHVTVDRAAVERLCLSSGGDVQQAVLRLLNRARNNAHARCPVLTGYLQSHIAYQETGAGEWEFYDDAEYAVFVHEGTRFMAGRPFLTDALQEEMNRL